MKFSLFKNDKSTAKDELILFLLIPGLIYRLMNNDIKK